MLVKRMLHKKVKVIPKIFFYKELRDDFITDVHWQKEAGWGRTFGTRTS